MRIERIELRHVRLVLVAPFVTSMGVETDEEHIIVRVDGEGVTGWGECVAEGNPFYSYETTADRLAHPPRLPGPGRARPGRRGRGRGDRAQRRGCAAT